MIELFSKLSSCCPRQLSGGRSELSPARVGFNLPFHLSKAGCRSETESVWAANRRCPPSWQPAGLPGHRLLQGRFCRLEPLSLERWGMSSIGLTKPPRMTETGPICFGNGRRRARISSVISRLRRPALTETRWWWSIRRTDAPWGPALLRIDPANGVAELGTINWSPLMRRSALGSEAIFLMLRHLFDDLGYRRCEWKCDSLNLPSRQAAERGFPLRRHFPPGGCRQRTHARHRLAVDHRRGMAGATRRLCRLAVAG